VHHIFAWELILRKLHADSESDIKLYITIIASVIRRRSSGTIIFNHVEFLFTRVTYALPSQPCRQLPT